MIFLRSVTVKNQSADGSFPFTLPIIRNPDIVEFKKPVVFFVGENRSDKSTLIESIALGMGAMTAESVE